MESKDRMKRKNCLKYVTVGGEEGTKFSGVLKCEIDTLIFHDQTVEAKVLEGGAGVEQSTSFSF